MKFYNGMNALLLKHSHKEKREYRAGSTSLPNEVRECEHVRDRSAAFQFCTTSYDVVKKFATADYFYDKMHFATIASSLSILPRYSFSPKAANELVQPLIRHRFIMFIISVDLIDAKRSHGLRRTTVHVSF